MAARKGSGKKLKRMPLSALSALADATAAPSARAAESMFLRAETAARRAQAAVQAGDCGAAHNWLISAAVADGQGTSEADYLPINARPAGARRAGMARSEAERAFRAGCAVIRRNK